MPQGKSFRGIIFGWREKGLVPKVGVVEWLLQQFVRVVAGIPMKRFPAVARGLGWIYCCLIRHRRQYVLHALQEAFPDWSRAQCRRMYREVGYHQALNVLEMFRFCGPHPEEFAKQFMLSDGAEQRVRGALERGKGVLILVAHVGNYDMMGMAASRLFGFPLHIITKEQKNKGVNAFWQAQRQKHGTHIIVAHNAYRPSVRALKENALVGFMLDQNRPSCQAVFVPFFGKLAATSPGLAFMSAHTKAPVIPAFMYRQPDGSHRIEVGDLIEPPPDRRSKTILDYTTLYTRLIEDAIRKAPEQWIWMHKRWKSRPMEGQLEAQEELGPEDA